MTFIELRPFQLIDLFFILMVDKSPTLQLKLYFIHFPGVTILNTFYDTFLPTKEYTVTPFAISPARMCRGILLV